LALHEMRLRGRPFARCGMQQIIHVVGLSEAGM